MKIHILIQIASGVIVAYFAYCCLLFLFQRNILFPRSKLRAPSGATENISGLEEIWLDTDYGKVEAWFIPPASNRRASPAPAVIFAHGNGELIDFWPEELKKFSSFGIGVLLVEYPGYGRSEGSPSQKSITEAFVAAYDTLVARKDVDPSGVVLFGRSLGGGAVCALATERRSAALILQSTFTSVRSLASSYLAPGFMVLDPFDNMAVVRSYSGSVLVVHGRNDNLIPYKHGVALCEAAPAAVMLSYDCGHNDCPPRWDTFWRDLELFLVEAGIIRARS